jgi:hypothetical protein
MGFKIMLHVISCVRFSLEYFALTLLKHYNLQQLFLRFRKQYGKHIKSADDAKNIILSRDTSNEGKCEAFGKAE